MRSSPLPAVMQLVLAKKILDLKSKIDVKEEQEMPIMTNAPKDAPINNYSNVDIPAITPDERLHHPSSMKDFNTVSKQKTPKKIRFSHVVDLETAKVEILSCCSKLSMGSCSSVDPSMDIDTTEVKRIMLIKEERNLRRIRASYGILYLAALSDDYIVWDDSNRVRKRKRHDTLDVIGRKGLQGCCMLRTPTLRVVVACASVIFIIFHTPFCVWYSISHMFPGHTMYDTAKKNLASTVVLLLTFCCNAINFLLYSTLTSKFQAELCSCLMCYHDVRRKQLSPNDSANVSEISVTEED
uniref:G-protein coupled receptors family 1 profile domain-containing protein n=1 Tax=Biomphalaria glabrata TaxID=6526 RepID=A0A2C9LDJ4_BIOGL